MRISENAKDWLAVGTAFLIGLILFGLSALMGLV